MRLAALRSPRKTLLQHRHRHCPHVHRAVHAHSIRCQYVLSRSDGTRKLQKKCISSVSANHFPSQCCFSSCSSLQQLPLPQNEDEPESTDDHGQITSVGNVSEKRDTQPPLRLDRKTPVVESSDPKEWLSLLDLFLPAQLKISSTSEIHSDQTPDTHHTRLLKMLARARGERAIGTDLLAYAICVGKHHTAVLFLVESLLNGIKSDATPPEVDRTPSNIAWPPLYLFHGSNPEITVNNKIYDSEDRVAEWTSNKPDQRYSNVLSYKKDLTMQQIWTTIGEAIIASADMQEEDAKATMSTVYRIIAQIHILGLVPANIYSYSVSGFSSAVTRPPILHLLSSRILTALSDAVWRSHSDEIMHQAHQQGARYKDLGKEPPGGRFRLKVRDLGPEVWLEFVLWCCAEGGFGTTGAHLINLLKKSKGDPWFAVSWNPLTGTDKRSPAVDWARVKLRTGGPVGRIEGYSGEAPLVEMPCRTVSAEVVQSLVEVMINSIRTGSTSLGIPVDKVQRTIVELVAFLEPHDLPTGYFDYLAVRLLQSEGIEPGRVPQSIHSLTTMVNNLRNLETSEARQVPRVDLQFDSIMHHSELQAGILHQALQAYMDAADVRQSIEVFAEIQNLVDISKLHAIGSFLHLARDTNPGFFTARLNRPLPEYVDSHGQLSLHQIAGFLNIIIDAKLYRLGQWLFYSDDVDGPLIPASAYGRLCLTTPIAKFAAASQDTGLMTSMLRIRSKSTRKLSVTLMRALANVNITFSQFQEGARILEKLRTSEGGGYGFLNVAHLGATILRLEKNLSMPDEHGTTVSLQKAASLLTTILNGQYNSTFGDYTITVKREFRQQVGFLLRIFQNLGSSVLGEVAREYQKRYRTGNLPVLVTPAFNMILEAVVETRGADEGKRLWDLFCTNPRISTSVSTLLDVIPAAEDPDDDFWLEDEIDEHAATNNGEDLDTHEIHPENEAFQGFFESSEPSAAKPTIQSDAGIFFDSAALSSFSTSLDGDGKLELFPNSKVKLPGREDVVRNPLVMPDVRTLRIIVRAALNEKRFLEEQGLGHEKDEEKLQDILTWASQLYRSLGISKEVIEQEIPKDVTKQVGMLETIQKQKQLAALKTKKHQPQREKGLEVDVSRQFNKGRFVPERHVQI